MSAPRRLVKGERIRLEEGGQLYEVYRVGFGAAYIRKVYDPPRVETFTERDGSTRTIRVSRGPIEPGIAPAAFVYREEVA